MPKLTNAMIAAAIVGFETQKKAIDAEIAEMRSNTGSSSKIFKLAFAAAQARAFPVYECP